LSTVVVHLATEWFEKAISKDKNYPLGWSNKAVCLLNSGLLTDAEDIIDKAIKTFPTNPYILREKGRILLEKDDPKNALKYFDKALRYHCLDKVLLGKAQALLRLRKHKETVRITDNILRYNIKNSEAWYLKGGALRKLHQMAKAGQCFKKAEEYKKIPRSLLE